MNIFALPYSKVGALARRLCLPFFCCLYDYAAQIVAAAHEVQQNFVGKRTAYMLTYLIYDAALFGCQFHFRISLASITNM
jgi:hypothetical protein